jgi:hypothetical protein
MRLTYSRAACDQLKQMFMTMSGGMYEGDTSYIGFEEAMCRPAQMFIAWDTDDMRRIAIVQGDTGTTTMDLNLWEPMSFWGEFYDRDARKEWWMIEGSQSNALLRDRGTCRSFSIPEGGMDVSCRLATLRQSFDMTLEEWEIYEYDDDYGYDTLYYDDSTNIRPRAPRAPRALTVRDTTYGDTGIVVDTTYWAPYVTHTMALRATALEGLALTVKQFNFEEGGYYRRMARKAALRNARLQRARPIVIP